MATKELIDQRKQLQFQIVEYIYDKTGGSPRKHVDPAEIAAQLQANAAEVKLAIEYLMQKRLLDWHGKTVRLTVAGVDEYSRAKNEPTKGTETFPAYVINHIYKGHVGVVQHGDRNTANVVQNIGADAKDIIAMLGELRSVVAKLPEKRRKRADKGVRVLESQAKTRERSKEALELAQDTIETALTADDSDGTFKRHLPLVGEIMRWMITTAAGFGA